MKSKENHGLNRIDDNSLQLDNELQIDVRVFANQDVPIEAAAVQELKSFLGLQETLQRFYAADSEAFAERPRIERISLTPDFHKARGIPLGRFSRPAVLWSHRRSETISIAVCDCT